MCGCCWDEVEKLGTKGLILIAMHPCILAAKPACELGMVVLFCFVPLALEYFGGSSTSRFLFGNISLDHMKYTTLYMFLGLPKGVGGVFLMPDFSLDMLHWPYIKKTGHA